MDYIANNLHKNLEKNIPNKNFLVVYDYKPKMLEEGCMKKVRLYNFLILLNYFI